MLTLEYCEDKALLSDLHGRIFGGEAPAAGVVLRADGKPCGVACYALEEGGVRIKEVGVLQEERGKGYGDFFTRALVFKFMQSGMDIFADGVCGYYKNLGFWEDGRGGMRVSPDRVVFPSSCKHREG